MYKVQTDKKPGDLIIDDDGSYIVGADGSIQPWENPRLAEYRRRARTSLPFQRRDTYGQG